ncbi:MAG TPA: transglycosylase SLT domain-containing protein [Ilumatobacteraceae bacterium]|nr:transglycosylase SLT domain-containing protein [Ilumatobacteraceae bacterium]
MSSEIHVAVPGTNETLRFARTVRIGRAETNGIVLNDDVVSAEHVELRKSGEGWEILDLGSTNGTFIDGEPVTRARLGPVTAVRLGPGGPKLHLTIPGLSPRDPTRRVGTLDIADRYLADEAPEGMSARTGLIRAAFQERREQLTHSWLKRTRNLRIAVGILVVVSATAGGVAVWQARRARALRAAAGDLFNTMKSLELDVRRLEAKTGPDRSIRERRARLEAQYDDLLKTLGIYSDRTPADVKLIYRTVHRLGESEATVPKGFVDEVRKYIKKWDAAQLQTSLARANAQNLGPQVSAILLQHNLPREFFYLALQESNFDPKAIGPSTRFGVPKGLWQIIPPTAEAYGLKLGRLQGERMFDPSDDRHNVAKSTTAAARYLEDIYTTDAQASGLLVMASYNMGETRLLKLIRSMPESPAQRNFWALLEKHRREIPAETYNYVFRVFSAAVICANPKLFGFDFEPPLGPLPDAPTTAAAN